MTWKIYRQDEKKTEKKYRKIGIELSINDNTKIPQYTPCLSFWACQKKNCGIYWLSSYNLLTSKNGLKSRKQLKIIFPFTDHIKKQRKYQRVTNELSILFNIKVLKYKSCLSFPACQKKFFEFIDSTIAIDWPTNVA